MTWSRPSSRCGFGMMEIIVLLGIASVIGVLMAVSVAKANRLQRINETWQILERTRLALFNAATPPLAFRQSVNANAGKLSELVTPIVSTDPNSCGGNLGNPKVNSWNNAGPFGGFTIDVNVGLPTPIGVGNNALVRTPTGGGGGSGTLAIVFPNVDTDDATLLDDMWDGSNGQTSGVIQWTVPAAGLTTMSYVITIDGTC
jgi:hypothetical protein